MGGFLLTVNGERRDVPARKVKALMCRLALDDAPLPREQLSALLWPDSPPSAARHSLRQALTELRRALQDSGLGLTVTAQEAALETYGGRIDVREFRRLAAAPDPESWARAMTLYRGSLLEGLDARVDTFDEWLDEMRRELAATAARLCRALADAHDGDNDAVIAWTRRLLALDPLDEAAHRDLMRSYIAAGQDGAAIRQFLHCRSVLERELGIQPDGETVALYEALLTHRHAAPAAVQPAAAAASAPLAVEAPAAPPAPAAHRLRPAVVLVCRFAADDSDPERAEASHADQLEQLSRLLRGYGGMVVGHVAGQAVCGFGLGRVRGSEADRACLAAAELVTLLPGARVGIASGRVLFRPENRSVAGQAVGEAQDLAARAAPGQSLASDAVRQACRYTGAAHDAPLVGRALEIRQFVALLDASRDGGYGCALLLRGEAGIGKTRLVQEYTALAAREGFSVHTAQAYDFGGARGQDPIAQLVRSLLGGEVGEAAIAARVGAQHVPYLQAVLGVDPAPHLAEQLDSLAPLERLRRSSRAVRSLVRAAAREDGLVLVVDDLHWADRLTLAVLPPLARTAAELPVLLVMTSRVAGEALDPEWRAAMGDAPLVTLDLRPLRESEADRLASALGAGGTQLAEVVERAGGNPLFIQQLVRAGRAGAELPHTIQALAVAQLDALPEPVQAQVRAASVLGQHFTLDALAATAGEAPELDAAVTAGLVVRGADTWRFHHALIRDSIYRNLLASERRELHARAAGFYRARSLELHAWHLDRADAPEAVSALVEAAKDELDHYRLARARQLAERALEREPGNAAAMLIQAQLDLMLGQTAKAAAGFEACRRAATGGDVEAHALVGLGMALNQLDDYPRALEALEAAVARNPDDHAYQADAWLQLGNVLFPQGLTDECLRAHQASLVHAERAGCTLRQARAEGGLGDAYYQQGAMITAFEHFDRCVRLGEAGGHASVVPPNLAMRGLTLTYQNRFADALRDGRRALELAEQSQNVRHELLAHNVLASAHAFHGDFDAGLWHAERTRELGERIGSRRFMIDATSQTAHLLWAAGRIEDARRELELALGLLDDSLMAFAGAYVRGLQALCAETARERRARLAEGERLLTDRAVSHCHLYFYFAAMEACLEAGDGERALRYAAALADYTRAEPLPFAEFFIRRVRLLTGNAPEDERGRLIAEARACGLGAGLRLLA
ncbi:MAG TPA: AAA family ATPase [Pseudomonadales bacterium]